MQGHVFIGTIIEYNQTLLHVHHQKLLHVHHQSLLPSSQAWTRVLSQSKCSGGGGEDGDGACGEGGAGGECGAGDGGVGVGDGVVIITLVVRSSSLWRRMTMILM